MKRMLVLAAWLAVSLTAAPAPLRAQKRPTAPVNLGHALQLAQQAYGAGDHTALLRALQAAAAFAPANARVLYHLVRAQAFTGNQEGALRTLERLAPQGAARDLAADSALQGMLDFHQIT